MKAYIKHAAIITLCNIAASSIAPYVTTGAALIITTIPPILVYIKTEKNKAIVSITAAATALFLTTVIFYILCKAIPAFGDFTLVGVTIIGIAQTTAIIFTILISGSITLHRRFKNKKS